MVPGRSSYSLGSGMSPSVDSLRVGLLRRLRAVECLELHAGLEDAHQRRVGAELSRIALGVEHLRHEAAIGHCRRIPVTEPAGAAAFTPIQVGLELGEAVADQIGRASCRERAEVVEDGVSLTR